MTVFQQQTPDDLALLTLLTALLLSAGQTAEEQNVFGNFLVAVGSIILVMAAQAQALEASAKNEKAENDDSKPSLQQQIQELKHRLDLLTGPVPPA